jgi:uncharacterized repeat protein (TIGR01451 family)
VPDGPPVTCDPAVRPCEGGERCNKATGRCEDRPDAPAGTECEKDDDKCTLDRCDGAGACVSDLAVDCNEALCEVCIPATGVCEVDTSDPQCAVDDVDIEIVKTAACVCGKVDDPRIAIVPPLPSESVVVCEDLDGHDDGSSDDDSSSDDHSSSHALRSGDGGSDDQGSGDQGSRDDGSGDDGSGDDGKSDDDKSDDGKSDDGKSDDGKSDDGKSDDGKSDDHDDTVCSIGFQIAASNLGTSDATGVVVTDLLPSGVVVVGGEATHGVFDPLTGIWTIGSLPGGTTAVLTIDVEPVDPANIASDGGDDDSKSGDSKSDDSSDHDDDGLCLENCAELTAVDQTDASAANDESCVIVTTDGDDDGSSDDSDDGRSADHGLRCVPDDHDVCDGKVPPAWRQNHARWTRLVNKAAQADSRRQARASLFKAKRVVRRMSHVANGLAKSGAASSECIAELRSQLTGLVAETKALGR